MIDLVFYRVKLILVVVLIDIKRRKRYIRLRLILIKRSRRCLKRSLFSLGIRLIRYWKRGRRNYWLWRRRLGYWRRRKWIRVFCLVGLYCFCLFWHLLEGLACLIDIKNNID